MSNGGSKAHSAAVTEGATGEAGVVLGLEIAWLGPQSRNPS